MAAAGLNPLEEILNTDVDESLISALVGTLETSLAGGRSAANGPGAGTGPLAAGQSAAAGYAASAAARNSSTAAAVSSVTAAVSSGSNSNIGPPPHARPSPVPPTTSVALGRTAPSPVRSQPSSSIANSTAAPSPSPGATATVIASTAAASSVMAALQRQIVPAGSLTPGLGLIRQQQGLTVVQNSGAVSNRILTPNNIAIAPNDGKVLVRAQQFRVPGSVASVQQLQSAAVSSGPMTVGLKINHSMNNVMAMTRPVAVTQIRQQSPAALVGLRPMPQGQQLTPIVAGNLRAVQPQSPLFRQAVGQQSPIVGALRPSPQQQLTPVVGTIRPAQQQPQSPLVGNIRPGQQTILIHPQGAQPGVLMNATSQQQVANLQQQIAIYQHQQQQQSSQVQIINIANSSAGGPMRPQQQLMQRMPTSTPVPIRMPPQVTRPQLSAAVSFVYIRAVLDNLVQ